MSYVGGHQAGENQVSGDHRSPWDLVKEQLQKKLSAESFENWIARTRFAGIEGKTMLATAPDRQTAAFLLEEYGPLINTLAAGIGLGIERVQFTAESSVASPGMPPSQASLVNGDGQSEIESPITLNPKFTFESFVVGSCNQFAHAAAQSVAMNPSRSYNPLFIYGGVGMGKTHLMHAIGRALMARGRMRIIYTTSERFTNEVVSGIKHERMPQLRARYRSADVLLIDDIQSLGSKERTQEEFFHTFNELHDAQKQIVLSSDCPPREITGLVERLRSRFEWGLMADIQPPDLETKMAILEKKAELVGITLPPEVCTFIASKTKSNVRELEGALVKLTAYSSLTETPISIGMAQTLLKDLLQKQDRRITIDSIQKAVAERFAIKPAQLKEKSNRKEIVLPRQVAMFLVKELTLASLPEIGRAFGGKHHTTVIHSINKIEAQRADNPDLNKMINSLIDTLQ
ncbi:MAG TPA: chromosomal replication initiator protein DnaA [Bryobacteraceae bacterium]|nr:chromosomal replication initiator protein DnaA [Bryobacteraceae bacterium]